MFENDLKVQLLNNDSGKEWKLLEDLVFNDSVHGRIVVPAGTKTDFSSVPRIPVVFELVGNMGHAAATVHDYLYHTDVMSRADADKVFMRALRSTETGKLRSVLMYGGVRAFGWMFFQKD